MFEAMKPVSFLFDQPTYKLPPRKSTLITRTKAILNILLNLTSCLLCLVVKLQFIFQELVEEIVYTINI